MAKKRASGFNTPFETLRTLKRPSPRAPVPEPRAVASAPPTPSDATDAALFRSAMSGVAALRRDWESCPIDVNGIVRKRSAAAT